MFRFSLISAEHGAPTSNLVKPLLYCANKSAGTEKKRGSSELPLFNQLLVGLYLTETIATVYRSVSSRLERNLGVFSAAGAYCRIHLAPLIAATRIPSFAFPGCAAARATTRIISKSLFGVEFLLRSGESKFIATVTTCQITVLIH